MPAIEIAATQTKPASAGYFKKVHTGGESSPVGGFPAPWQLVRPALIAKRGANAP